MSDEVNNKTLPEKPEKEVSDTPLEKNNAGLKWLSILLPLVLLASIIACIIFVNQRTTSLENQINESLLNEQSKLENFDLQLKDIKSRFTEIGRQLEQLENKQDVLNNELSRPVQQQITNNKDYALAEIEHLLIIANYRLQLEHNIPAAISALESADLRIKDVDDTRTIRVREQIIADINQLKSINQADLSGLGLYLSDLIDRVDALPLKEDVITNKINNVDNNNVNQDDLSFFKLIWQELKGLVVITRDNEVARVRLIPDEIYFLRSNIKLELANARFAVFNRDTENLHASIGHVQSWLNNYFDLSDAGARNIYDSLNKMQKLDLSFPNVDLNSSLESLRALIRLMEDNPVGEETNPLTPVP